MCLMLLEVIERKLKLLITKLILIKYFLNNVGLISKIVNNLKAESESFLFGLVKKTVKFRILATFQLGYYSQNIGSLEAIE